LKTDFSVQLIIIKKKPACQRDCLSQRQAGKLKKDEIIFKSLFFR